MRSSFAIGQKIEKQSFHGAFINFKRFLSINVLVCQHVMKSVARMGGQLGQEQSVAAGSQSGVQKVRFPLHWSFRVRWVSPAAWLALQDPLGIKQLNNLCIQQRSIYWGARAGFFMAACDPGIIKATVAETLKSSQSFVLNYTALSSCFWVVFLNCACWNVL